MNKLLLSGVVASSVLLTACGGSNKNSPNTPTPTTPSKSTSTTGNSSSNHSSPRPRVVMTDNVVFSRSQAGYEREAAKLGVHLDSYSITIGGRTYPGARNVKLKDFGYGFSRHPYHEFAKGRVKANGMNASVEGRGTMYIFQQGHSAIAALHEQEWVKKVQGQPNKVDTDGDLEFFLTGEPTKSLPQSGNYHYKGESHIYNKASNVPESQRVKHGTFDYTIDFGQKTGQGRIVEAGNHIFTLEQAPIRWGSYASDDGTVLTGYGIKDGTAKSSLNHSIGEYSLGIFGPNANEVTGHIDIGHHEGFMGGTKQ